jgi:pyruvate dehydrogenase E1 component alpha subunit
MQQRLTTRGELSAGDIAQMETRVASTIEQAAEFALNSPFPAASELTTDVYA